MRRPLSFVLAASLTLLVACSSAQAQRFFGRGGTGLYFGTPYYGYGSSYYNPGYGYYNPGYYARPYYGGMYPNYYYSPYQNYGWYSQPYASGGNYYSGNSYWPSGYLTNSAMSNPYYSSSSVSGHAGSSGMPVYQAGYRSSGSSQGDSPAWVRVTVPNENARVWFNDQPTQQTGMDRLYVSPPLQPGSPYYYTVKATWMADGREVNQERKVEVKPGQETTVNFSSSNTSGSQQ
jgi:uncharacterized protein (TIGR03000 family)